MKNLETELERRTVTYTVWNQSTTKTDNGGWHPFTFSYADAGSQQIETIKVCIFHLIQVVLFLYLFIYLLLLLGLSVWSLVIACVHFQDINHVYYETEYRTEWCSNNSTSVPCFLFARKFSQGAAMRLLSQGVVGNFDVSALFEAPP